MSCDHSPRVIVGPWGEGRLMFQLTVECGSARSCDYNGVLGSCWGKVGKLWPVDLALAEPALASLPSILAFVGHSLLCWVPRISGSYTAFQQPQQPLGLCAALTYGMGVSPGRVYKYLLTARRRWKILNMAYPDLEALAEMALSL